MGVREEEDVESVSKGTVEICRSFSGSLFVVTPDSWVVDDDVETVVVEPLSQPAMEKGWFSQNRPVDGKYRNAYWPGLKVHA